MNCAKLEPPASKSGRINTEPRSPVYDMMAGTTGFQSIIKVLAPRGPIGSCLPVSPEFRIVIQVDLISLSK